MAYVKSFEAPERDIKSLKVNFEPIQAGTGDPSPTNVRAISGRSGLAIKTLPTEYQAIEYVQNPSWSHINTDYIPQQYDRIHIKFMIDDTTASYNKCLLSAGNGTYQLILLSFPNDSNTTNGFYYKYFATGSAVTFSTHMSPAHWYTIDIDASGTITTSNGYTTQSTYQAPIDGNNSSLVLFRRVNGTSTFVGKISEFSIERNGEYKVFFIPCYRKSDNEIGFYDVIRDRFFINATTDDLSQHFTAGPTANPPSVITKSTDWSNTIYGGYVDFAKGELVETWGYIPDISVLEWAYTDGARFTNPSNSLPTPTVKTGDARTIKAICPIFKSIYNGEALADIVNLDNVIYVVINKFYIHADGCNGDVTALKNLVSEVGVAYELETPVVHTLTKQQLKTIAGLNNLWSDAGDIYVAYSGLSGSELLTLRNKIIMTPHVATTQGANPLSFKTDISATMKSCLVDFKPKQTKRRNLLGGFYTAGQLGRTATSNGITYTPNADGSVTIDGTSTGDSTYYTRLYLPAGKYYYSYGDIRNEIDGLKYGMVWDSTNSHRAYKWDGVTQSDPGTAFSNGLVEELLIESASNVYNMCCRVNKAGIKVNNVTVYPAIFRADETDFSFCPYAGYNAISGFTDFSAKIVGKNLIAQRPSSAFPITSNGITFTKDDNGVITANGTADSSESASTEAWYSHVTSYLPPGRYLATCGLLTSGMTPYIWDNTANRRALLWDYRTTMDFNSDGSFVQIVIEEGHTYTFAIRVTHGATVNNAKFYPMICMPDETDPTYEPYRQIDSFELNSGITRYGTKVDYQNGYFEVYKQYIKIPSANAASSRITSINTTRVSGMTTFWYWWSRNGVEGYDDTGFDDFDCDTLFPAGPSTVRSGAADYWVHTAALNNTYRGSIYMAFLTSEVGTTAASIMEYLQAHPFYIVANRNEPDVTTNQYLVHPFKSGKGKQNFLSASGNEVELKYWTH